MPFEYIDESTPDSKFDYISEEPKKEIKKPENKTKEFFDIPTRIFGLPFGIKYETPVPTSQQIAESGAPIQAGITQTAKDIFATPASFFNQMFLNYPRSALAKGGIEFPQPGETTGGKVGETVGGIAGAVTSPIYRALGALTGAGKVIAPSTKLGTRIGLGALGGATAGAAYAPTENSNIPSNLMQRTGQAALGGVLGGTFGLGAGIFRNIQKLSQLRKGLEQIKTDIGAEELPKSEIPRKVGETISDLRDTLKQSSKEFDDIIETESLQSAKDIKPKLRQFGEKLSKSYGDKLDEFDNEINKINRTALKSDVGEKWISSSLDKVSDDPLAVSKITKFAQDRGYQVVEYVDDAGRKTYSAISSEGENPISFKELVNWKNSFKKGLSASAKSGTGLKKEDLAYKSMQDSWGEFLESQFNKFQPNDVVSKQFSELQSEYAPLAQAKWQAYKTFKPFDPTDINIDRGTKFFRDYAMGKAKAGQEELINIIEKGNELSPGIGDISSRIKSLGYDKITNEKQLSSFIEELVNYQIKVKDMIAQEKYLVSQRNKVLLGIGLLTGGTVGARIGGILSKRE